MAHAPPAGPFLCVLFLAATGCASQDAPSASASAEEPPTPLAEPPQAPATPVLRVLEREEPIERAFVVSLDNDNTSFRVTLFAALEGVEHTESRIELVYGTERFDILGVNQSGEQRSVSFQTDAASARRLAGALDVALQERRYSGHELRASFLVAESVAVGAKNVPVKFVIENVGPIAIDFLDGGHNRNELGRDNRFTFEVERDGEPVDTRQIYDFGGLGGYRTIEPGESYTLELDLAHWITVDRPGTYHVSATYEMDMMPGHFDHRALGSYEERAHLYWDEEVSASFEFAVE